MKWGKTLVWGTFLAVWFYLFDFVFYFRKIYSYWSFHLMDDIIDFPAYVPCGGWVLFWIVVVLVSIFPCCVLYCIIAEEVEKRGKNKHVDDAGK